jgi:hypothetical protein
VRSYTIKKIEGTPDWNAVPVMPMDCLMWTDSTEVAAQTQICWDAENLYIRQQAWEKNIRAEESGPMCMPCLDSCMEFFFRPTRRDAYINVEIHPNKAIYLGYGPEPKHPIRLQISKVEELFDSQVEFTEDGWVLRYRIPFAFIRWFFPEFEAKEGTVMHGNAYKCGNKTVQKHFLAWNPIGDDVRTFHCPQYFGELIFDGE